MSNNDNVWRLPARFEMLELPTTHADCPAFALHEAVVMKLRASCKTFYCPTCGKPVNFAKPRKAKVDS